MEKQHNSWFGGIQPPPDTGYGEAAGYLDRLMGNQVGNSRKQFFQGNQRKQNHHKTGQKPTPKCDKSILSVKSTTTEIDDQQWLEERRKKFPKVNDAGKLLIRSHSSDTDTAERPAQGHSFQTVDKPESSQRHKQPPIAGQRRKTLFEKLMEGPN